MIGLLSAVLLAWTVGFLLVKVEGWLDRRSRVYREMVAAGRECLCRVPPARPTALERNKEMGL